MQEYPTLTTFFAGEIISRKRPFLTRKWDADEDVDRKHWVSHIISSQVSTGAQLQAALPSFSSLCAKGKFQAFYQYAKTFNSDDFDYEDLKNSDYIFMRWKVRCSLSLASQILAFFFTCEMQNLQFPRPVFPLRSSSWSQTTRSRTSVVHRSPDSITSASRNPQQLLRATTTTGAPNGNSV